MSDFFRKEFSIRPVLIQDTETESVIIRRGTPDKPRVLVGFNLNNEEVVGKRDGEIVGFPWGFGAPSEVIIPVGETREIHRFEKVKSQNIKVDIDAVDGSIWQSFISLICAREEVKYNKFSVIGKKIKYDLAVWEDSGEIIMSLANNHTVDLVSYTIILG